MNWSLGADDRLDLAPEVPILRTRYEICAHRGPGFLRCDRPTGHGGRHYESIWDGEGPTEFRAVIGVWGDE